MIDFIIELNGIRKSFQSNNKLNIVLNNIDLKLYKNEILCLIGPNGCGKTTLFNIISGIDLNFEGKVIRNYSTSINDQYPGVVFQEYEKSLMPWLNCKDNILFPLSSRKQMFKNQNVELLNDIVETLGINSLPLQAFPYQMSGGEKQMTCIARAMITNPQLLILDEPFSSLDYSRKQNLYSILQRIYQSFNIAIILITHNIDEGILFSDRVLVLSNKPTHIIKEINVDLPRPRNEFTYSNPSFLNIRNEIINIFECKN